MSGHTITVKETLTTVTCCSCGVLFAMTDSFIAERRRDHVLWYCPNGHSQHYTGKNREEQLKEQLDEERRQRQRAEQNIAYWTDEAKEAREKATRERNRANGYKGFATRITKRAKAGVCPCCNRTFKQLQQHMANKHPEFTPLEISEGVEQGLD